MTDTDNELDQLESEYAAAALPNEAEPHKVTSQVLAYAHEVSLHKLERDSTSNILHMGSSRSRKSGWYVATSLAAGLVIGGLGVAQFGSDAASKQYGDILASKDTIGNETSRESVEDFITRSVLSSRIQKDTGAHAARNPIKHAPNGSAKLPSSETPKSLAALENSPPETWQIYIARLVIEGDMHNASVAIYEFGKKFPELVDQTNN